MVFLYVDVHLFQEHESSTWAHFQAEIPTKVGTTELFVEGYHSWVPSEWKLPRLGRPRAMSGPLADMLGPLGMLAGGVGKSRPKVKQFVSCFGVI